MAYSRYDRNCKWYIFWQSAKEDEALEGCGKSKEAEALAVWHGDHRAAGAVFTYTEICEMLDTSDFSSIPGYTDADRALISRCLSEFVCDVDKEHDSA